MAYDTKKLFKQAKKLIPEQQIIFMEDLAIYLGISKTTLYRHIGNDSDEMDELKALIQVNKVVGKAEIRKKWYSGNNATTQIALYKLLANPKELAILTGYEQNTDEKAKPQDIIKELKALQNEV